MLCSLSFALPSNEKQSALEAKKAQIEQYFTTKVPSLTLSAEGTQAVGRS